MMVSDSNLPIGVLLARVGYALFDLQPTDREHVISLLEQSANKLRISSCDDNLNNKIKD